MATNPVIKAAQDAKSLLADINTHYPRLLNRIRDYRELTEKDQAIMDQLYERMENLEIKLVKIKRHESSSSLPSLNMLVDEMGRIALMTPDHESASAIIESGKLLEVLFTDLRDEYDAKLVENDVALTA